MNRTKWSPLYKSEDWWAVWLGLLLSVIYMKKSKSRFLMFATIIVSVPLVLWCLNTLIQSGYFGPIVQKIYTENRDASAIFWTDTETSPE
ncbi:hypothetical protein [Mastigocoleus testarum]|uniref:Uncharacterized protein n=1 Tax=Mastigocoleus testarum BC008 TaxID=371196 RepID=A0A0V7ZUW9_9CYAN|nr:hypothetical protein [Mastigocoleus testarum]KST64564.1 hypothetical protein BC008_18220 [Mastigocoleus testarum BC008]KST68460.1 hypothetical protein BC008_00895 [Mastigocoleus testarum BC008]